MYRYHLQGRSLTIPRRIYRITVQAHDPEEARRLAKLRIPDFGDTVPRTGVRRAGRVPSFTVDQDLRCRFCHRYVVDGLYTRVSFPDGVSSVCDFCRERADDDPDFVEWRGAQVQVTD